MKMRHPLFRSVSMLALCLLASGCALINKPYKAEPVETQSSWLGMPQSGEAAKVDAEWWKAFGSAEMNGLIEQAKAQSFDIQAAVARIRQADAQASIAGAPLLPELGLNVDATRNRNGSGRNGTAIVSGGGTTSVVTTGAPTTGATSSRANINNSITARLRASYEIDFWGKNAANATSAEVQAKASRFDKETVELTTVSSVANTYLTLVALKDRIELARLNLTAAQDLLKAIQLRADNGLASALDLAQQQNLVATQQTQLPVLELQFAQNRDALALLLGKAPQALKLFEMETLGASSMPDAEKAAEAAIKVATLDAITIPEIAPGLPSQLLTRRPDVQYAEAQLISAHADINAARAAFFPSITLTGTGGYASTMLSDLFRADSMLWSIGASAAQTIFDNGALFGQFDFQKARYDELLQNYRKSVASSFADVEDALAGVKFLAEQEVAQKEAMRTADLAFGYAQRQFKEGIVDITNVLDTQRALFSARDAYAQVRLARLQSLVGLYKALGGGWDVATPVPDPAAPTP